MNGCQNKLARFANRGTSEVPRLSDFVPLCEKLFVLTQRHKVPAPTCSILIARGSWRDSPGRLGELDEFRPQTVVIGAQVLFGGLDHPVPIGAASEL